MCRPGGNTLLITVVIAIDHSSDHRVVAEGVERQDQINFLEGPKCAEGQEHSIAGRQTLSALSEYWRGGTWRFSDDPSWPRGDKARVALSGYNRLR